MQNITISGYLSKDAETATTQGGDPVTRWNIPVKQGWGEREQTNWYRVSIWGKRADFAAKARKGELAFVVGELTIGEYQGKPQYEIRAAEFQSTPTAKREDAGDGMQRPAGNGPSAGGAGSYSARNRQADSRSYAPAADLDSDIPFIRFGEW